LSPRRGCRGVPNNRFWKANPNNPYLRAPWMSVARMWHEIYLAGRLNNPILTIFVLIDRDAWRRGTGRSTVRASIHASLVFKRSSFTNGRYEPSSSSATKILTITKLSASWKDRAQEMSFHVLSEELRAAPSDRIAMQNPSNICAIADVGRWEALSSLKPLFSRTAEYQARDIASIFGGPLCNSL